MVGRLNDEALIRNKEERQHPKTEMVTEEGGSRESEPKVTKGRNLLLDAAEFASEIAIVRPRRGEQRYLLLKLLLNLLHLRRMDSSESPPISKKLS